MPDWKVHLIFGLFFFLFWLGLNLDFHFLNLNLFQTMVLFLLVAFLSIFPDVDMKRSKSRKVFALFVSTILTLTYVLLLPATWYYGPGYFFLSYFLITLLPTKHRGLTHTFQFSLALTLPLAVVLALFFNYNLPEALILFSLLLFSYLLHLILDKL